MLAQTAAQRLYPPPSWVAWHSAWCYARNNVFPACWLLVLPVLQVSLPTFHLGLPAYYVLALSEASSNLSRYDGVRYGLRATEGAAGKDLKEMYAATR